MMKMSNKKDSLGDRMKNNYENRAKTYLVRRMPVIIRLDGKAFHTFTKGLKKPYDEIFHNTMNATMKYLCENIQGCKLGYTQSDEITLLLTDYDTLDTDAWFGYNVQKMCSVSASMATMAFNKFLRELSECYIDNLDFFDLNDNDTRTYVNNLRKKCNNAMFDARCFNIPVDEVTNCFIWRQQDATRNAIQMLGQCNFSHKELQGKSCNDIQDMLMLQKGINFNDMPTEFKRGVCCRKEKYYQEPVAGYEDCDVDETSVRTRWVLDKEIPIFTQDREYVENTFKGVL
jgi:tRNA(His) 5'-end guanylyltransferase